MTSDELTEMMRCRLVDAMREVLTDAARPWGLEPKEANAAILAGVADFLGDVVLASTKDGAQSRAFAAAWAASRVVARVEAKQCAGNG